MAVHEWRCFTAGTTTGTTAATSTPTTSSQGTPYATVRWSVVSSVVSAVSSVGSIAVTACALWWAAERRAASASSDSLSHHSQSSLSYSLSKLSSLVDSTTGGVVAVLSVSLVPLVVAVVVAGDFHPLSSSSHSHSSSADVVATLPLPLLVPPLVCALGLVVVPRWLNGSEREVHALHQLRYRLKGA